VGVTILEMNMSEEQTTLLPFIDDVCEPFWRGCREGVLRIQQCPQTKRLIFPPRPQPVDSAREAGVDRSHRCRKNLVLR